MRTMLDRNAMTTAFLAQIGWGDAKRQSLAGDASARRYERLILGDRSAILMDSPPGAADDPADFVAVAHHLRQIGLNAPEIYFADLRDGYLLLEDFGDDTFAKVLLQSPAREADLYALASDVLVKLQAGPAPGGLANLAAMDWADAAMLSVDWYRFALTGDRADPRPFRTALTDALHAFADGPRVVILRDYHAENLMWLPACVGLDRAGLLDFQLAQMGQPGYDLVSLLQDVRRDVSPPTEAATIARFCAATGTDVAAFRQSYAALGVQRALRILGIFTRLCLAEGKPGYIRFIPRVWAHLQRNLVALDLAPLTRMCHSLLPAPDATALETITRQCARHPLP
jgi:N-acetylmuramate 1-kinase